MDTRRTAGFLTNLPAHLTHLVGRDRDAVEVRERLLRAERGLLTLTGAGGCGKTSLALHVASGLVDEFPNGVCLARLAPLSDPALVPGAVAGAFGLHERPRRPLDVVLADYLRTRSLLLVLDNCEHLVDACAALVEHLLSACPDLRILATSREPLRIAGEAVWRVPSLAVPDLARLPGVDELGRYAAVRLFVQRGQGVHTAFRLSTANASAVAQICVRLDGIPLALELAAARVRILSVDAIVERLDDSFRLLTGGSRTASGRQQTLKATLDWSHDLLTEAEQALFRRLAVFAGGFDLQAAEAVCTGDGVGKAEILDLLTRLADKSMVVVEELGEDVRYRLLEPIRQYADRQLRASGDLGIVRQQHAAYFLAFAEQATIFLHGGEQGRWLARVEREHENLRTALRWGQEQADTNSLLRIGAALSYFWFMAGHFVEGQGWLRAALDQSSEANVQRCRALCGGAFLAWGRGDYERAIAWSEEAITVGRQIGDAWGVSSALWHRGSVAGYQGEYARARSLLDEGLALARELGDTMLIAALLINRAEVVRYAGDHEEAHALLEEYIRLREGNAWQRAIGVGVLGYLELERGNGDRAAAFGTESLTLVREVGVRWYLPEAVELLAMVASARHQPRRAARLFGAADAVREATGAPIPLSNRAAYDRHLATARAALDEAAFAREWAAGRALPPGDAIQLALETTALESPPVAADAAGAAKGKSTLLTRREREVAALIARGLTTRQIAEELIIAEGTANIHVGNILSKLGFASRAQVASWATAHGLLEDG